MGGMLLIKVLVSYTFQCKMLLDFDLSFAYFAKPSGLRIRSALSFFDLKLMGGNSKLVFCFARNIVLVFL